jgi:exodeoxyribonuclease V beta subunit
MRFAHASAIAAEIGRLLGGGARVTAKEGGMRALRASDVFVLTRTGKEATEVAEALRAAAIPYALSTQESLWATREASDVLDVLRALEDPGSRARRIRAWMTPFFGVAADDLDACRELPADHPHAEHLARWAALAAEHRFAVLFHAMLSESGLARRLLFLRDNERELVNYEHVLELLLARASRGRLGLRELASELEALTTEGAAADDESLQRLESERAAVQVLTMHKSKGLEAEVVFLFGGMTQRPARSDEPRAFHDGTKRVAWIGPPPEDVAVRVEEEERQEHERLLYVAMTRARSRLYLPYVGPAPGGMEGLVSELARGAGAYRVLGERLLELAREGALDPATFERRTILVTGARRRIALPPPLPELDDGESAAPRVAAPIAGLFDWLRESCRGVEVTSYTRMKAHRVVTSDEAWKDELVREPSRPPDEDDPLPSGAAFGVFVHEVLERIDFARVLEVEETALLEEGATRAIFEESAERSAIDVRVIPRAAALVWRTLRTPIRCGGLDLPRGLAAVGRRAAELTFLHPIPERTDPALGAWLASVSEQQRFRVERGFVRGVIDLVFEHGGKTWVLDWKTDRLAAYDAPAIAAHAEAHYEIQARLYALGAARMLKIASEADHDARFGGIVYCFLRGIRARSRGPTEGVHARRPDFATLGAWDRAMREDAAPWGHPLPPRRPPEVAR